MARPIGTTGSAPASKTIKVKAHTRRAPTPKPRPAGGTPKPVRVRVRSTAPPQTPDSRDNNRLARHPNVAHASPDAQDVTARSPHQEYQCRGDNHVSETDQQVRDDSGPENPGIAGVAVPMRKKVRGGDSPRG